MILGVIWTIIFQIPKCEGHFSLLSKLARTSDIYISFILGFSLNLQMVADEKLFCEDKE